MEGNCLISLITILGLYQRGPILTLHTGMGWLNIKHYYYYYLCALHFWNCLIKKDHYWLTKMVFGECLKYCQKMPGQTPDFKARSTARAKLVQVLNIVTCGSQTYRGDSL